MKYDDNALARYEDLINNPAPRVPVCLCLDTSYSMKGEPIDELNAGVRSFYEELRRDEDANDAAELCIVTYGNGGVQKHTDFSSLELQPDAPTLTVGGNTPMGEGVNLALDLLERRKEDYKRSGVDYYQPWLVLMTDGVPFGGSAEELERARKRTLELARARRLTIIPIAIGEGANISVLASFSPQKEVLKLKGLRFSDFFAWLSQSVARVSQSMPGEDVPLDYSDIPGWGDIISGNARRG